MHKIITGSVSLLAILILGLVVCPNPSTAQAEDLTTTKNLEAVTRVISRPTLSVALSPVITLDLVPKSTGTYGSQTTDLKVSTNSRSGFTVLMHGVNGTALTSTRNPNSQISATPTAATLANLPNNTWGYYFGEQAPDITSEFQSIPETSTVIKETDTSTADQTYKLAFGTKIDTSLEAGTYSNSVLVSVVANPVAVSGLQDLYFMQDITPELCTATPEGTEAQLTDSRDGNKYWVAKLKDGNCWMTQNLDLDLSTERVLTSADSDIEAGTAYLPSSNTNSIPLDGKALSSAVTNQWSWDFGKIIPALPNYGVGCDTQAVPSEAETYAAQIARQCGTSGIVDVSNQDKFKPNYQATDSGEWTLPDDTVVNDAIVSVKCTEWTDTDQGKVCTAGSYDAHYLIGNLYQWLAVTAGSASRTSSGADVPSSLCPKGWRLARSYTNDFSSKTWANLLKQYGLVTNSAMNQSSGNQVTATVDGQTYNLFYRPLYFNLPGYLGSAKATLLNLTANGTLWSSTAGNFVDKPGYYPIAYVLNYTKNTITPMGAPSSTSIGNCIRCVNR